MQLKDNNEVVKLSEKNIVNIPSKNTVKQQAEKIFNRLLVVRPQGEIEFHPFYKNDVFQKKLVAGPLFIELKELYPDAKEGNVCYVGAKLKCIAENDLNLWIWGNVKFWYEGKLLYDFNDVKDYDPQKGGCAKIHVNKGDNDILFMCRCHENEFGFSVMPAITQYKWWARDYIFNSRITSPLNCFRDEDGVAISRLYEREQPFDGEFVFPAPPQETGHVDFGSIFTEEKNGDICYALTYALDDTKLKIRGKNLCVLVNKQSCDFENELALKKGDEVLVKSSRNDNWGFEYSKTSDIGINFIQSKRAGGDRWLVLGAFGNKSAFNIAYGPEIKISFDRPYLDSNFNKTFWRFADKDVYLRPYMDTCFFAQWFYANMVASYGILNFAEEFNYKAGAEYFFKSMQYMATFYNYCTLDKKLFNEAVFLEGGMKLNSLDPIGTIGMNMVEAYKLYPDSNILSCIELLCDAIKNNILRFEDGTFRRSKTMWADDVFMSCPFLVRLGLLKNDTRFFEEIQRQLRGFKERLYMEQECIYSHIYFIEEKCANKIPWGRGNGWIFNALSDVCLNLPDSFEGKKEIVDMFVEFAYGLKNFQDEDGLWHQVLNCYDSYAETSGSAMFLLGISRGINKNILKKEDFLETAVHAYNGLVNKKIDSEGNIYDICKGSGCSMDVDYYKELGTIENDDHGTGIILAAFAEFYKMLDT